MGKNKPDVSRRTFLRRSAMLVSSLGVGTAVQSGLMDAIARRAKKNFGTAMAAAETSKVDFMIEICFRAGFQGTSIGLTKNYFDTAMGSRAGNLNATWSTNGIQKIAKSGQMGQDLYLPRVDGRAGVGAGVDNPLSEYADKVVYTQSYDLGNGHSNLWRTRSMNGAPVPIVAHAGQFDDVPVRGVQWNPGGVTHVVPGGYPSLTNVASNEDFIGLYKDVPMYFTFGELKHLVGTFDLNTASLSAPGALQKLDALWSSARKLPGASSQDDAVFVIGKSGRAQSVMRINLDPNLPAGEVWVPPAINGARDIATLMNDFGYGDPTLTDGDAFLGDAMFHAYRAFAHNAGLLRSFVINLQSGDWHGDTSGVDVLNNKQGRWARSLTRTIGAFMAHAANTPNPLRNDGSSIADSLLIKVSSEFFRTVLKSSDNGDGGSQGVFMVGSNLRGGSYGDTNVAASGDGGYGTGRIFGFDPQTGNTTTEGGNRISEQMAYNTTLAAMGLSRAEIQGISGNGDFVEAMIR